MHTHRSMRAAATAVMAYLGIARDDVLLGVLPLAFSYGLYQLIMGVAAGARLVLAGATASAYPASLIQLVAAERVTVLPGVPGLFATLLPAARDTDRASIRTVRIVTSASAPLPVAHLGALCERFAGAQVFSMYGLTECKRVSYLPPDQIGARPASVGVAIPGSELWIVDEHDRRLPCGDVGQLVVRSPTIMRGYWDKPGDTAARLRPGPRPGERVLYTGDLARFDDAGYLYVVGRMDDIIKSRGEKVAPREVESVLAEAPGVREAAVIGVRDDHLGEAIAAFVVADDPTLTARTLLQHCRRRLEPHMVPKHVVFAPALPRTPNGKVDKRRLAL